MKDVALVIPVFNRKHTTLLCLESIFKYLPSDFIVIVCDSGSVDGTLEAIRQYYPDVLVVQGDESDWWTASTNRGIRVAIEKGCDFILTFNDDNLATPGIFSKLLKTAKTYPDSIVSSIIFYSESTEKILFAGRRRSKLTDRFIHMNHNDNIHCLDGGIREVDLLHGMCTLFPVSVFQSVGFFDETYFPHLFADDDLILKAKKKGFKLLVDLDAAVFNDHTKKGLTPYERRLGPADIVRLIITRKSIFQLSARSRFFWRHRRSVITFLITMISDYSRLTGVILLRWVLTPELYKRVEKFYLKIISV